MTASSTEIDARFLRIAIFLTFVVLLCVGARDRLPAGICPVLLALPSYIAPRHETAEHPSGQRGCGEAV